MGSKLAIVHNHIAPPEIIPTNKFSLIKMYFKCQYKPLLLCDIFCVRSSALHLPLTLVIGVRKKECTLWLAKKKGGIWGQEVHLHGQHHYQAQNTGNNNHLTSFHQISIIKIKIKT